MPGLDASRRRARRLRLAADADVGRPRGDPDRGPDGARRPRRRCARTRSSSSDEQNWTTQRHRHHARVLRHPQLAGRAAAPRFTQSDVDGGDQGRRPRPDRRRQALRPERRSRSGRRCASRTSRSQVVGVAAPRRASRRTGQDYDDARVRPGTRPSSARSRAGCRSTSRARSSSARPAADDDRARRDARHRPAARSPPHRSRRRRRLLDPQPRPRSPARSRRAPRR